MNDVPKPIQKAVAEMLGKDVDELKEQDYIDKGVCPICGHQIRPRGGCKECVNPQCGFELCG